MLRSVQGLGKSHPFVIVLLKVYRRPHVRQLVIPMKRLKALTRLIWEPMRLCLLVCHHDLG